MNHVLLLLPLLGLVLFFILPIPTALPIYIVILIISLGFYMKAVKAMKLPVKTGEKGLVGMAGKVVKISDDTNLVSVHGELWNAVSKTKLKVGMIVKVIDVKDLTLTVKELKSDQIER